LARDLLWDTAEIALMSSLILAPTASPLAVPPDARRQRLPIGLVVAAILFLPPAVILSIGQLYLDARGFVADRLIRHAWDRTCGLGQPAAIWPGTVRHPIARVAVRGAGLDAIVLSGSTDDFSEIAPTWLSPNGAPNSRNDVVISAGRQSWRRSLARVDVGDVVTLQWLDTHQHRLRTRRYRVDEVGRGDVSRPSPATFAGWGGLTLVASLSVDSPRDAPALVVHALAAD
jgi:hypothetical protein